MYPYHLPIPHTNLSPNCIPSRYTDSIRRSQGEKARFGPSPKVKLNPPIQKKRTKKPKPKDQIEKKKKRKSTTKRCCCDAKRKPPSPKFTTNPRLCCPLPPLTPNPRRSLSNVVLFHVPSSLPSCARSRQVPSLCLREASAEKVRSGTDCYGGRPLGRLPKYDRRKVGLTHRPPGGFRGGCLAVTRRRSEHGEFCLLLPFTVFDIVSTPGDLVTWLG